jgi:hypothetical protein
MKRYLTIVAAILTSAFLLFYGRQGYVKYQQWRERREAQRQADRWCQRVNEESGAVYHANDFTCVDPDGSPSKWQGGRALIEPYYRGYVTYVGSALAFCEKGDCPDAVKEMKEK